MMSELVDHRLDRKSVFNSLISVDAENPRPNLGRLASKANPRRLNFWEMP